MRTAIILFLFICIHTAYAQQLEIPKSLIGFDSGQAYLKRIDYFDFKNESYVIDSANLDDDILIYNNIESGLYTISDNKEVPLTLIPLRNTPQYYNYFWCANFYINGHYLLFNNSFSINEFDYLKSIYSNETCSSELESVYDDNGQYRNLSIEEAELIFKKIEEVKTEDLFQHKDSFSTSFISYIETEIRLYTVNGLLNWYENVFKDDLNEEYNNNQHSTVHEKYFQMFLSKKWNRNSIQYFRTVERLTNYNLSKQAGELKLYHEDSEVKDAIRKEILQTTSLNL